MANASPHAAAAVGPQHAQSPDSGKGVHGKLSKAQNAAIAARPYVTSSKKSSASRGGQRRRPLARETRPNEKGRHDYPHRRPGPLRRFQRQHPARRQGLYRDLKADRGWVIVRAKKASARSNIDHPHRQSHRHLRQALHARRTNHAEIDRAPSAIDEVSRLFRVPQHGVAGIKSESCRCRASGTRRKAAAARPRRNRRRRWTTSSIPIHRFCSGAAAGDKDDALHRDAPKHRQRTRRALVA